jgi:hypothetical protein
MTYKELSENRICNGCLQSSLPEARERRKVAWDREKASFFEKYTAKREEKKKLKLCKCGVELTPHDIQNNRDMCFKGCSASRKCTKCGSPLDYYSSKEGKDYHTLSIYCKK